MSLVASPSSAGSLITQAAENIVFGANLIITSVATGLSGGTLESGSSNGLQYERQVNSEYTQNAVVELAGFGGDVYYSVLDTSVAAVDTSGNITLISGTQAATMVFADAGGARFGGIVSLENQSGSVFYDTDSLEYVSGSAADRALGISETLLSFDNSDENKQVFLSVPTTVTSGSTVVRNPSNMLTATGHDITGIAANRLQTATAITPIHAAGNLHYPLSIGSELAFVGEDNSVYTRTVVARISHPDSATSWGEVAGLGRDIALYRLDLPLPAEITPLKVFDDSLPAYWSSQSDISTYFMAEARQPKTFWIDQNRNIRSFRFVQHSTESSTRPLWTQDTDSTDWGGLAVIGDSSSFCGIAIGGELVFTGGLTFSSGTGYSISGYYDWANQALIDLDTEVSATYPYTADSELWPSISGSSYQMIAFDLSGYSQDLSDVVAGTVSPGFVSFASDATEGVAGSGLAVTLAGTVTAGSLEVISEWYELGDGQSRNGQDISYTYAAVDATTAYTVTANVMDAGGNVYSQTRTDYITLFP